MYVYFNFEEEGIYGYYNFTMHMYLQSYFETAASINVAP